MNSAPRVFRRSHVRLSRRMQPHFPVHRRRDQNFRLRIQRQRDTRQRVVGDAVRQFCDHVRCRRRDQAANPPRPPAGCAPASSLPPRRKDSVTTGWRVSVLNGSGVMNCCASAVITTRTLHLAFVNNDAKSAALCAAIEPVTPRTIFFETLMLKTPAAATRDRFHFLRLDNRQRPPQILLHGGADEKIIEILPLRDFLPRHGQTFLDFRRRIRRAFFQPLLQFRDGRRRQKHRHQRALQFRLVPRTPANRRRALHVHVQQNVPAGTQFVEQFRFQNAVAAAKHRRVLDEFPGPHAPLEIPPR